MASLDGRLEDFNVLFTLVGGKKRPSEIVKELEPQLKKYDSETLSVLLSRVLKKLVARRYVRRLDRGHQNVSYEITVAGLRYFERLSFKRSIDFLGPTEFQVLETLLYIACRHVSIMAPSKATVKDYFKLLRACLNKNDVFDKAQALLNDPRKLYLRFSGHVSKFKSYGQRKLDHR